MRKERKEKLGKRKQRQKMSHSVNKIVEINQWKAPVGWIEHSIREDLVVPFSDCSEALKRPENLVGACTSVFAT